METCMWGYDSDSCYYDTACGGAFAFMDERLEESRFKFCPYCGKSIQQPVKEA